MLVEFYVASCPKIETDPEAAAEKGGNDRGYSITATSIYQGAGVCYLANNTKRVPWNA